MIAKLSKLSRRDRIALGLGGGGVALFLILSFGVLPQFDQLGASTEGVQQKEVELRRDRRLMAEEAIEKVSLSTARERLKGLEAGLLEATTPSLASAEWQRLVSQLAESKSIQLMSSESLRTRDLGGGYSLVTGRAQFRCRLDQFVDFVAALTSFSKLLSVTDLSLYALPADKEGRLNVQVTIGAAVRTMKVAKDETAER